MRMRTNEQKMAQAAYECVSRRIENCDSNCNNDYKTFALSFPSLVHACGLAQALAFAKVKKHGDDYLKDLQAVFEKADDAGQLDERSRNADLTEYMRISRRAMSAASWIKRYCQAYDGGGN